jgi:GT2 family glycosyltransferase
MPVGSTSIPVLIVPVLCGPVLLHRMLASIDFPVDELVIIDNGHVLPPGRQVVENVQRTHVITMPNNLGVSGSWNIGIKGTPYAPWWMIVNFDVVFLPGTLQSMAEQSDPDVLLLGYGEPDWQYRFACFTVGERVVESIGLFDERFFPAYWEDHDYERRAAMQGYVPKVARNAPFFHESKQTAALGGIHIDGTWELNKTLCEERERANEVRDGSWSLSRRRRSGLSSQGRLRL